MRYLFLVVFVLSFFSCKTQEHQNVLGKWIDKENENIEITFFEKEGKLLLDGFSFEFKIEKLNDTVYVMNSDPEEITVNLNNTTNELNIGGRMFIREDKTLANKIRGSWVNSSVSKNIIYEFRGSNYSNSCYVWTNGEIGSKYYPRKTEKGFEFTIGYDWVIFNFDEHGNLYDAEGNAYTRAEVGK